MEKYIYQEEYQKRVGLKGKTYKLHVDLVSDFAKACEKANVSQAHQLSKMMQGFIDEVNRSSN